MASRIVVFGATGFTGQLVARSLVSRGVRPVLAARSAEKVERLAADLGGLPTALADVSRPGSVRALVERGDVLVATVGPFVEWGAAAVEAAAAAGAHYLDSTGEPAFIRQVYDRYGPEARRADSVLLTAFGFDWVPGHVAAGLALREAGPDAVRVDIGYLSLDSGISGGTKASSARAALEPSFGFRNGQLRSERTGGRIRSFTLDGRQRRWAFSVGGTEHFGLPKHYPSLREVNVMLAGAGPATTRAMPAVTLALAGIGAVEPLRRGLINLIRERVSGSTGGPDAESRQRSGSLIVAEAFAGDGQLLHRATLSGVNAYDFTGDLLAWGAIQAADGAITQAGVLDPISAFGLDPLTTGVAEAGIQLSTSRGAI
ncbi:trans-acting enoyl reductase family protein [Williamsia sp. DF01-3]|uniref:saccharopine dehydrogenase family protein n=1 Tax=Williamsia sp. DF01-3 TaxID=2934157 RepID=UPI000DB5FF47|nr:saccharopine dehydrogenase NADP-binding domain-containing protein [Williamsia sp. DF01-3]MCK0515670.1 saccharopine dehydrogenase NADP-binding domain-containing protein [Williamsia sp. DF01-3]PZT92247.1 MAG: saccharopine dehydrogenase [Gordonia sp. (in: high G+C Gram-positive bacteria)]